MVPVTKPVQLWWGKPRRGAALSSLYPTSWDRPSFWDSSFPVAGDINFVHWVAVVSAKFLYLLPMANSWKNWKGLRQTFSPQPLFTYYVIPLKFCASISFSRLESTLTFFSDVWIIPYWLGSSSLAIVVSLSFYMWYHILLRACFLSFLFQLWHQLFLPEPSDTSSLGKWFLESETCSSLWRNHCSLAFLAVDGPTGWKARALELTPVFLLKTNVPTSVSISHPTSRRVHLNFLWLQEAETPFSFFYLLI